MTCEPDDDTTYSAGSGLSLSGTAFAVNTGDIQQRVTGTCSSDNAIRIITGDGTVTCQAVSGGGTSIKDADSDTQIQVEESSDEDTIRFDTAGSERMIINSTGDVGIGTSSPDASSILELSTTTKGFLPPRLTATQRDAISSPAEGLLVYNTGDDRFNFYNGSAWSEVGTVSTSFMHATRSSSQSSVASGDDIVFNSVKASSGVTLNTTTGVFTLEANKTYELEASLYASYSSANGSMIYEWVDSSNASLSGTVGVGLPQSSSTAASQQTVAKAIITTTSSKQVKLRITIAGGTLGIASARSYARIVQIGTTELLVGVPFVQDGNSQAKTAVLGTNDANDLAIETNNSEIVRVTSTGDVGIGDTTPDAKLDVSSSGSADGINIDNTAGDGDPVLAFQLSGTSKFTIGVDDGDEDAFKIGTASLGTNTRLTISGDGSVGIGDSSPDARLDVSSSGSADGINIDNTASDGDPVLRFQLSGTSKFTIGIDDGDEDAFKIGTTALGTDTRLTISGDGSVGIGTSAPTSQLHIKPATAAALQLDPHGTSAGNVGELRFLELAANGANYVGFQSPDAIAANVIWTLPNADGTSDQVLKTDGSGALSWTTAAGLSTATLSTADTLSAGTEYHTDTSGAAFTLTLPSAPSDGTEIRIVDVKGTFDTNNVTVNRDGTDTIQGSTSVTLSSENGVFDFHYDAGENRWTLAEHDTPAPVTLHQVRMTRSTAQSISTATETKVTLNAEDFDTGGIGNTSTGTVTITQAGRYTLNGGLCFAAGTTFNARAEIYVNGTLTSRVIFRESSGNGFWCPNTTIVKDLSSGDTVELYVYHQTGSSVNTSTPVYDRPFLEVIQLPTSVVTNVAQAAEYIFVQLAGAQTTNISAGDHVKFDTVVTSSGSSATLDTSTTYTTTQGAASIGRFTLKAGKTYRLDAGIPWSDDGYIRFKWYDATNNNDITGTTLEVASTANGSDGGGGAIFTATGDSLVELRVVLNVDIAQFGNTGNNLYPWAIIETIADGTQVAQFTGATASAVGTIGFIPKPETGDQGALLLGNSDWTDPANELFVDTTNDRVGIGDTTPDAKLDVSSSASADGINIDNTAGDGDPVLSFQLSGTSVFTLGVDDGDEDAFKIGTTSLGTNTRLTISGDGSVGIGDTSPDALLDVSSSGSADGIFIDNTAGDGDPILAFQLDGTSTFTLGVDDSDSDKFKIGTTGVGTNTRLTIDASGNVGIGDTAPGALLDLSGATSTVGINIDNSATDGDAVLSFQLSGTSVFTMGVDDGDEDAFKIGTTAIGTNTRLTISGDGSVGIGTTTPSSRLHVASGAGATTAVATIASTVGDFQVFAVNGTPLDSVTGSTGDIAVDSSAGNIYIKNSGGSSTSGWVKIGESSGEDAVIVDRRAPEGNTITTLDTTDATWISMTIGVDGLPLISYRDAVAFDLKVAHCSNPACTSATITTADSSATLGSYTSITIGSDGLGLITYYTGSTADLKVAHCSNTLCTSSTITTLDGTGDNVGAYSSIAIGADGLALISYRDATNTALKVAHCSNINCTSATISTIDTVDSINISVAFGPDGLGLISYYENVNANLRVAHCSNTNCTSATITTLDSTGSVGEYTSITIGADGLGLISYYDASSADLNVAHCSNTLCNSATLTSLDTTGNVGAYTSVTIGPDGLGIISHWDVTNGDLKVSHCSNVSCTSAATTTVDSTNSVGEYTAITIGVDGLPIIAYRDATNTALKVVTCSNAFCSPFFRRR